MVISFAMPGIAPDQLTLSCPPAAQGQSTNPTGDYDVQTVASAVHAAASAWITVLTLLVVVCYQWRRGSLGPAFVKRWWGFAVASMVVGAGVVYGALGFWPTSALANSCQSDPRAFPTRLPGDFVAGQTLSAFLLGLLLFVALSVVLTLTIGRIPRLGNGFFHNRGCPLPRILS